ncbi:MAG: class I SAM-dependent methyltransferase [Acidobacteriota bacterium]
MKGLLGRLPGLAWAKRMVRQGAQGLTRRIASQLDLDLVRKTPYSPVPTVPPPSSPEWERASPLAGITLDPAAQLGWLEATLAPHLAELCSRVAPPDGDLRLDLRNGYYQLVDAALLWAMVRHFRPRRLLELGAGFSTLISAAACAANAREDDAVELVSVDPEPRIGLAPVLPGLTRLERRSAAELPLDRFLALEANDILFIDTTHTVKRGSEVNYLVLEVLPCLRAGVVVHFHDIFLPYEYPREWFAAGTYLAEQYLLQAFLIENDTYEILFAAHAVSRALPARLAKVIPLFDPTTVGQEAFWMRRR